MSITKRRRPRISEGYSETSAKIIARSWREPKCFSRRTLINAEP